MKTMKCWRHLQTSCLFAMHPCPPSLQVGRIGTSMRTLAAQFTVTSCRACLFLLHSRAYNCWASLPLALVNDITELSTRTRLHPTHTMADSKPKVLLVQLGDALQVGLFKDMYSDLRKKIEVHYDIIQTTTAVCPVSVL